MPTLRVVTIISIALLSACADAVTGGGVDRFAEVRLALTIDPDALPNYRANLPAYYAPGLLAREDRTPLTNPTTDAGATLGRVLFFDRNLSRTRNVSCASCHEQSLAFGDSAQRSLGIDGVSRTAVHSMRLANARFNESGMYFWDRRAPTLESQVTQPVQDAVEMGFDAAHGGMDAALARLDSLPYYAPLFTLAFGTPEITHTRVQRALAQYVRSIVAVASRWDAAFASVPAPPPGQPPNFLAPLAGFTAQELRGRDLFFRTKPQGGLGCQGCHAAPSFSLVANSLSNGLDEGETRIFRAPSLKDVGRSSRFMHDGRFTSLAQVVDFYLDSIQPGPALDPRLLGPGGEPQRINLSPTDRAAVVAFLRTLSDINLPSDPRFSDPFRRP
jgi:cytochrome c peroxidase